MTERNSKATQASPSKHVQANAPGSEPARPVPVEAEEQHAPVRDRGMELTERRGSTGSSPAGEHEGVPDVAPSPGNETPGATGPEQPAVRIVGRGDVVIVQLTRGTGAWVQTIEMLRSHLSQAGNFFHGEFMTLELGEQPVNGSEIQEILNLLAEYEINLRQIRTANPRVHQVAQDLGLAVSWQSPQERESHGHTFNPDDNWEVLISGGQAPNYSVADFQMPPAIIDSLAEGIHGDRATTKRVEKKPPPEPDGRIVPAVRWTLMAHPTDPDLVQRISAPPYVYRGTLRSGQIFRHAGSVMIIGDVNPGAHVVSASDIFIWGRLRGVAHAGAMGDESAQIGALEFDPIQVRIAGHIAMSPRGDANDPGRWFWKRQPTGRPEVARVLNERIVVDLWDSWFPTRH